MPKAKQHRRSKTTHLKDTRLLLGVGLILVSMLLGGYLYSAISATTTVLVAKTTVGAGQELKAENFEIQEVRLENADEIYLSEASQIPAGALALKAVGAGEMLTKSSVGQAAESTLRPITIEVEDTVAASLVPGAVAELWVTGIDSESEVTTKPLVDRAIVRSVDSSGGFSVTRSKVEVLVPQASLAAVLQAIAQGNQLYVVEIPGEFEVRQ